MAADAGVHFDELAGLGILEHEPAEGRQLELEAIRDMHGDNIMPAIGLAQCAVTTQ